MIPQKTMSPRAWAELLLLSVIWGASFLCVELILRELPVLTLVAIRVLSAAAVLWAWVLLRGIPIPASWRIWGAFLVMGALNNAVPFTLLTYGQVRIESGLTSILNATTAINGVLLAAIFFRDEKLTPRKVLGVGVGFAGVVTAIGPDALTGLDPRSLGQLAALGATVSYGFAMVWGRFALGSLRPEVAAAGMLTGSSLIMVPTALLADGFPQGHVGATTIIAMAFFAIFATAFAYLLYYRVLALAGSGNLGLVTLFVPVVAIILGTLVLGERLSHSVFAGFGMLALGMIILDGRTWRALRARF
jgi:drug/metabolite transporter (DMT)-like permease